MSVGKLFREVLGNFLRWAMYSDSVEKVRADVPQPIGGYAGHANMTSSKYQSNNVVPTTFNFTITNAAGGKVISVRHYDPNTDRSHENVYIVTEQEDLGQELAQIITKESLYR